ncbi:lysozyme inhibitor LprI family protein [Sandaracinobacter sp. RS1-74]|uniref:lysozyme inhibitor LprI family protein n=1 Tax=Sandaracinobacteroides sayramensis TaxID=2913411 RepID=UPI001EDBA270|nr:lysozyme inhibitor LprI family protein [Sandaracinobacteroides sayramensis]MCG2839704.1 lysozyme inhibitor LprI family protein [Sandaracinobacteroides sayramensis]
MSASFARRMALALLLAIPAAPALAADCADSKTQAAMNACIKGDFASADKTLNTLYQRLLKKLEPEDAKLLQAAQRSWISFRDKHCAFVANPNSGGSIYPTVFASCAASVTTTRAAQLRGRLYCQEGDMGCGS